MIKDENGKVYLRYYQPIPKLIKIRGKEFMFTGRMGISIAVVEEEYVQDMLNLVGGCCGGKRKIISVASEEAVNLWVYGQRTKP